MTLASIFLEVRQTFPDAEIRIDKSGESTFLDVSYRGKHFVLEKSGDRFGVSKVHGGTRDLFCGHDRAFDSPQKAQQALLKLLETA